LWLSIFLAEADLFSPSFEVEASGGMRDVFSTIYIINTRFLRRFSIAAIA
jgi:hypothetical protein